MVAISLLLLALAAGTYLLIVVKREFLNNLFKALAWLIIILSLLSIAFVAARGIHQFRMRHRMGHDGEISGGWMRRGEMMYKDGGHHGSMDSTCSMNGCIMQGDSVIWDKAACEKAIGKDACDKMCKERGRCIMSKEECIKMCQGSGAKCCMMSDEKKSCCMDKDDGKDGKKECCKKK